MSETAELVLDDRFNAGERPATLVPDVWHADGEYHVAREDPDSAVHYGADAVRKQMESWIDAYPNLKVEALEGRANGDQVFVWVRFVGHGAGSGLPVEMELAHIVTVRDGKVARVEEYYDRSEALKAVELGE